MSVGFVCYYETLRPGIYMRPTKEDCNFLPRVKRCISQLEETATGKRLLEKISQSTSVIFIKHGPFIILPLSDDCYQRGVGCDTAVHCSISDHAYLCLDSKWSSWDGIDLVQGLIQGYHNARGKNAAKSHCVDKLIWKTDEHYHAIMGFPSKKSDRKMPKITVNSILRELHRPAKFSSHETDTWSLTLFWRQRIDLALKVYHRTCQEHNYDEKSLLPPPISNCTCEDLEHAKIFAIFYYYIVEEKKEEFVIQVVDDSELPDNCVAKGINPERWQRFARPTSKPFKMQSMGICRLSKNENKAMEIEQRENSIFEMLALEDPFL
jgi:hypothetical protein